MQMNKFTKIGRPVDPSFPTNLAILIGFGAVFLITSVYQITTGSQLLPALSQGFAAGLALFLGWAYAREIDPDHPLSAFFSAVLVLSAYLWIAPISAGVLFFMLLASRILSQTTGEPPGPLDSIGFFGLALWQMASTHWIFGILGAAAFLLDSRLPNPAKSSRYFSGGLFAASAIYFYFYDQGNLFGGFPLIPGVALALTAILSLPLINKSRNIESLCDYTYAPLYPQRVRTAQVFSLFSGSLIWLVDGRPEFLAGIIAVMLGAAVFNLLPNPPKN